MSPPQQLYSFMKWLDSVLYLDNHLLIAVKPPGMLTQPDETTSLSLQEELKAWIKEKERKPGNVFLHALHRLDRPTSGLVLFARSSKALSRLNEAMREGRIERVYVAEVEGRIEGEEGRLDHFLIREEHRSRVAKENETGAKKARLTFQVLKQTSYTTFVRIFLATGRYHQIRVQFAAIGHPVLHDARYGAKDKKEAIHLHCTRIAFLHPVTKELIAIENSPLFL